MNSPIELNHPYDSNNRIAATTVGYQGRGTVFKQLSVEAARDIQRLGNIGLGKKAYYELGRLLRQKRISFPHVGIKGVCDENWSVFGNILFILLFNFIMEISQSLQSLDLSDFA